MRQTASQYKGQSSSTLAATWCKIEVKKNEEVWGTREEDLVVSLPASLYQHVASAPVAAQIYVRGDDRWKSGTLPEPLKKFSTSVRVFQDDELFMDTPVCKSKKWREQLKMPV